MFKIDAADYMLSLCGDDALRELVSPGKSGSVFYLSHDDRFIIKTMKKAEVKVINFSPFCFGSIFWFLEACLAYIYAGSRFVVRLLLELIWSVS